MKLTVTLEVTDCADQADAEAIYTELVDILQSHFDDQNARCLSVRYKTEADHET